MTSVADEKDAIRETMARYCHALDACRFAEVAALFAEDGEWTTSYGTARGRAEIAAIFERNVPKPGEGPQRKHYVANIIVTLSGDRAEAQSDYLVVRDSDNGPLPVMCGTYHDAFVKRDGRWQFARKRLEHNFKGDMALKNGL